jgi:hypothetical protein
VTSTVAILASTQHRFLYVNSLYRDKETGALGLNEIGRVQLGTIFLLLCDLYSKNRLVYPDRRGHRRHRRCGDDQLGQFDSS